MNSALFRYPRPKIQIQQCPEGVEELKVQDETPCLHTEVLVPERDEEPSFVPERECRETSLPPGGDREQEGVQRDSVAETAALALRMSNSVLQLGECQCSALHTCTPAEQTCSLHYLWCTVVYILAPCLLH